MNLDYLVNSHPAVLDGYIHLVRGEIRMLDVEKKNGDSPCDGTDFLGLW